MVKKINLENFERQIFFATVRVISNFKRDKSSSVGTGFLYAHSVDENSSVILLISNRHVLKGIESVNFALNERMKTRLAPRLGKTVEIRGHSKNIKVYVHPDPKVDLACINVTSIMSMNPAPYYRTLNKDILFDFNKDEAFAGATVTFVGYPDGRFDVKHNLPIMRRGTLASMPEVNFNGLGQIVVDAQVFPGSSGSPVFAEVNGMYKLIGIVSMTMVKNQQLQTIDTDYVEGLGIQQTIGLGIIVKSSEIKRLTNVVDKHIHKNMT